jgi:hypothetical protein
LGSYPPRGQRTRRSQAPTSQRRPTRAWRCPCVFGSAPASFVTLTRPHDDSLPIYVFCCPNVKKTSDKKIRIRIKRTMAYTREFLLGGEAWIGLLRQIMTLKTGTTRVRQIDVLGTRVQRARSSRANMPAPVGQGFLRRGTRSNSPRHQSRRQDLLGMLLARPGGRGTIALSDLVNTPQTLYGLWRGAAA